MTRHIERDDFVVLIERRNRKTVSDDDEVDRRQIGRKRRHPAALAAAMHACFSSAIAGEAARLPDSSGRIGGQLVVVVRERSGRFARTALVIDKRADSFCRKLALQCEVSERGLSSSGDEYHDGHASRSGRQDEPSGQCRAGVLKL